MLKLLFPFISNETESLNDKNSIVSYLAFIKEKIDMNTIR